MRLIDADALENDIRKVIHKRHGKRTVLALYMMLDIVRDRDTIKVRPAKHGKWSLLKKTAIWKTIFPYQYEISCSVCGYGTIACDEQAKNDWLVDMNFCPNCGAKMDGDDKNEDNS